MAKAKRRRKKAGESRLPEPVQQTPDASIAPRRTLWIFNNVSAVKIALIAMLLVALPSFGFFWVSATREVSNRFIAGFDVRTDCKDDIEVVFAANPNFDTGNMQVAIAIKDYAQKAAGCTHVQFVIPGFGVGYRAVRSITVGADGNPTASSSAREAGKIVTHDLGYQTIDFDTRSDTRFDGNIQLLWPEGIQSKSFAERRIVIPFTSPEGIGSSNLKTTPKSFRVSMPVREGKLILKEKSHEFFGRRAIGNMYFYYFDVERKNSVLEILFEDASLSPWKDRLQNVFAAIFGAGLALVLERLARAFKS